MAEREAQITELALSLEREREKALEEMDGGDGGASLADRRELRVTVSTGVQTLSTFEETSAAVLSVNSADAMATRGVVFPTALQNGAVSATMQSLGPEDEVSAEFCAALLTAFSLPPSLPPPPPPPPRSFSFSCSGESKLDWRRNWPRRTR